MRTLTILGLMAASVASAETFTITTKITIKGYKTAMLGGADKEIFTQALFGYPPGTKVKDFDVECGPAMCTVTAQVDPPNWWPRPKNNDGPGDPGGPGGPPHFDPPGGNPPGGNPPGDNPPGGGDHAVPEIDPGTAGTAISLLGGVMLVLRGRRKVA